MATVKREDSPPPAPDPFVIQPHERIAQLKECLAHPEEERQRPNILTLIRMYETGELGPLTLDKKVLICDGKIWEDPFVSGKWPPGESPMWLEAMYEQMAHQGQVQPAPSQIWQSGSFGLYKPGSCMHWISVSIRLPSDSHGAPGRSIHRSIVNDTGSNVQTIFDSDLRELHFDQQSYSGITGREPISTAAGTVFRQTVAIEMQIVNEHHQAMTPWFPEVAVVTPDDLGPPRLSGKQMRNYLYFATAPGNQTLFVATHLNGLLDRLSGRLP